MKKLIFPMLLLVVLFAAITSQADPPPPPQTSVLWGPPEAPIWDPAGGSQLRDFTNVGYKAGVDPIPVWDVGVNVANFGAIADDGNDDSQAFIDAIAACPDERAVFVPNGVYQIERMFNVSRNNIVIRGESRDGAIIYFPKHLRDLYPDLETSYSAVSFINFNGGTNRGIENLSLVFRDEQKATGYFRDPALTKAYTEHWFYNGENPIAFGAGEHDSWMRDVYIKNANHAIRVDDLGTRNITLMNIVLDQFAGRSMMKEGQTDGHMGIKVGSGTQRCLVHNVLITGKWDHDICPMGTQNSVFSRIRGENIELDHHAMGNSKNLFTEIDTGIGGRGYGEAPNNFNETYWGIKGIKEASYLPTTSQSVFVGIHTSQPTDIGATWHHETLDPDALVPANIYLAQLTKLGKIAPADAGLALPPAVAPFRLQAVDDARVEGGNSANLNYGFDVSMSLNNGNGSTARQALLKFDPNALGITNAASAKLKIYLNNLANPPFGLQVLEVSSSSWSEATLTHANQPPAGAVIATSNLTGGNRWVELDITAYVNSRLALGDQTICLKLKGGAAGSNNDAFTSIQSQEGGNSAELVIHTDASTVAPPAAPTGLTAAPNDNRVNLNWSDNTESDLASYNVYRYAGDSNFVIEAMGLRSSDYQDVMVVNGTTYTYLVKAVDAAGTESQGIEISATPVDLMPPAAPTGLGANADDNSSVSLAWNPNTEEDLASYNVYRSTISGSYGAALVAGLENPYYEDTSIVSGTTYYYKVTAVDGSSNESLKSAEASSTGGVLAQTTFLGGDIGTVGNWNNGLPTSPLNRGLIAVNGTVAVTFAGTYYIIQTAGTITQSGVGTDPKLVGGSFTQNGGTWGASGGRGFVIQSGNLTTLKSGSIISGSNGNAQITAVSTMIVNGGTFRQYGSNRSILLTGSSSLRINGGNVISAGGFGIGSLASGNNSIHLNGGTVTVNTIGFGRDNSGSHLTVHIGGTTPGSFAAANFTTPSSNELVTERSINWLPGSMMSFAITGADEWAEAEWAAGRLTFDGQGTAELGTWEEVTITGGLGYGYRFAYDSSTETLTLTTSPSQYPPVAANGSAFTNEDTPVVVTLDATDVDSASLTYTVVATPTKGVLSGTAPNLAYTPDANANGADSFTFIANDGLTDSNVATISLTVNAVNDAPVAANGSAVTNEDTPLAVTLDATDIDSGSLTYTVVTAPTKGVLSGTAPNLTYTPSANYNGADSFTFKANDGTVDSNVATVNLTVNALNDAPVAAAGADQTLELPTVPWTPAMLAPLAWYDATDAATISASAGLVSQWNDKSGNANHMVQATSTKRPATGTSNINGFNAIAFDGTNDALKTATNPFGASINNAMVLAVVNIGTIANSTMFSLTGSSTGANRWQTHCPWGGGTLYFDCGGTSGANRLSTASGWSANQNKLLGYYDSTTENVQQMWADGALRMSDVTGHAVNTVSGISLGNDGSANHDNCTMGEVVILNGVISAATRQKIEGYLAHKWGMAATLPSSHPYRNAVPTALAPSTVVTLDGTASDVDGDALSTSWSVVSGPGTVTFGDASALDTTVAFNTAGTYVLRLTANDPAAQSYDDVIVTVTSLPLPWSATDIGTGMLAGSDTYLSGTFGESGSGVIGSTSDKLHYAYQMLSGDGEISARISSLENTGTLSSVGLMIRDSLASNSMHVFMGMTGSNAYQWSHRASLGGTTTVTTSGTGTLPDTWVRLVRSGSTITAYKSADGINWTSVGSATGTTFASTCYIGLAVGSGSDTTLNNSQFSNVSVNP